MNAMYAVMHIAYLTFQALSDVPVAFVVIRHDMDSFTYDAPQRALHSLMLAIWQPTVQDRRRIGPLDMHTTSQLDDNGNFGCERYYDGRRSSYWLFLEALYAFIVAQRQPFNIHRTP